MSPVRLSHGLPFDLFSSRGLGISSSSLSQIGSFAAQKTFGQAALQCYFNLTNGNLVLEDKRFVFPDIGAPIQFAYLYNSQASKPWRLGYGREIKKDQNMLAVTEADGKQIKYIHSEDGFYYPNEYADSKAKIKINEDESYELFDPQSNCTELFSTTGLLTARIDQAGNKTQFEYEGSELSAIIAPSGSRYEFKRSAEKLEIFLRNTQTNVAKLLHTYVFKNQSVVKSSTSDGYEINYDYQKNVLSKVTQSDTSTLTFGYQNEKVTTIQVGKESPHTIKYDASQTEITHPNGQKSTLKYDTNLRNLTFITPVKQHEYKFNEHGQIEKIIYPDQTLEQFEYDEKTGLIKKHTHRDGSYTTFEYSDDKPLLLVKTLYDLNQRPHPTHYFYQTINKDYAALQFEVSAEGRVKAFIVDQANGLTKAIYTFFKDFFPTKTKKLSPNALRDWVEMIKPEHIIKYNYTHDGRGRVAAISVGEDHQQLTKLQKDDYGNVIERAVQIAPNEFSKNTNTFDDLSRITQSVSGVKNPIVLQQRYEANTTISTLPNGREERLISDESGEIVTEMITQKSGLDTKQTTYIFYPKANARLVTDSDGQRTFEFYDSEKNLIASITPEGNVTIVNRDPKNRLTETIRYEKKIKEQDIWTQPSTVSKYLYSETSQPSFTLLQQLMAAKASKDDRKIIAVSNLQGKIHYEIDEDNYLKEIRYNSAGHETHRIRYKEKITADELKILQSGGELKRVPDRKIDEVFSTFYDLDEQIIAEQDPAGYVKEFVRDAGTHTQETILYHASSLIFSDYFAEIKPQATPGKDAHQFYFYNELKQCVLEIDAENYVTTHEYYDDGKPKHSRRFENKLPQDWQKELKTLPQLPNASVNDETLDYSYDEHRRTATVKTSNGDETTFQYDDLNVLIAKHIQDNKKPDKHSADFFRGIEEKFDVWGNNEKSANAFVTEKIVNEGTANWQQATLRSFLKSGLKIKTVNSFGKATFHFYDKDKHPLFTIDPTGIITENVLNSFGECIDERRYYNKFTDLTSLSGGYVDEALLNKFHALRSDKDAITHFDHNKRGLIQEKIDPEGNKYKYQHDAFRRCVKEEIPVSSKEPTLKIEHEFEQRGLETKTTKTADGKSIATSSEYQNPLGKKTAFTDEVGGRTVYDHDLLGNTNKVKKLNEEGREFVFESATHDAFSRPLDVTNADNETTTYRYNQVERTTIISSTTEPECKTIITKNIFGEAIHLAKVDHDQLLHEEFFTNAANAEIATHTIGLDEVEKNEHNLLGQISTSKSPIQGETELIRNDSGQIEKVVRDPSKLKIISRNFPNAFGLNETEINPRGKEKQNEFYKTGELKKETFKLDNVNENKPNPIIEYDRNAQGSLTHLKKGDEKAPNQYHEQYERDGFNRITAKIIDPELLKLRTSFAQDDAGNVIREVSPKGFAKRIYFNILNRKRFEINDLNETERSVVEYQYTDAGKIKSIRQYAIPLLKSAFNEDIKLANISKIIKPSAQDHVERFYYDEKGREKFKLTFVNAEKNPFEAIVEEKQYDGAYRVSKTIFYKTSIFVNDLNNIKTADIAAKVKAIANPLEDRTTYHWYNKASRETLTINQSGLPIEKVYRNGQVVKEIQHYNKLLNPEAHLREPVEVVLSQIKSHLKDRITHFVRDKIGRLIYKVLPNRKVIKQTFDENSNKVCVCRFKARFNAPENYDAMQSALDALKPDKAKGDSITGTVFDERDQQKEIIDPFGNKDKYERNALGLAIKYIDRAAQIWQFKFDRALRLKHETSPKTTITQVIKQGDKLKTFDIDTTITKKTDFDNDNNAVQITEGIIEPEALKNKDALLLAQPPEPRIFNATYQANQTLAATSVTAKIDDGSKYSTAWDNLANLPEKKVTLVTNIVTDTQGRKIAECDEAGIWSFYIRDALGRIKYEIQKEKAVIEYTYNAFNEMEEERRYSTPCNFDASQFSKGMTLDDITFTKSNDPKKILLIRSEKDRLTKIKYTQGGKPESIQSAAVFYFSNGEFGKAQPETKFKYNIFDDPIYEAKLIRPGVWAEKYTWPDEQGYPLATLDENKHLTTYERNTDGKAILRTEYAIPFKGNPLKIESSKELEDKIEKSKDDRRYVLDYDFLQHQTFEQVLVRDEKTSKFVDPFNPEGLPSITRWQYTPLEKLAKTISANGGEALKFYEPRGILVGETQITRTNIHGGGEKITPFTKYKLNAFGQRGVTQTSPKSCLVANDKDLPTFSDPKKVYENISLFDDRGLMAFNQDAEEHLTGFTHTPKRLLARELQPVSLWHLVSETDLKTKWALHNNLHHGWAVLNNNAVKIYNDWIPDSVAPVNLSEPKLIYQDAKKGFDFTDTVQPKSKSSSKTGYRIKCRAYGDVPPVHPEVGKTYHFSYQFTNTTGSNIPSKIITRIYKSSDEFQITDNCNGKKFGNNPNVNTSYTVDVVFTPKTVGGKKLTIQLQAGGYKAEPGALTVNVVPKQDNKHFIQLKHMDEKQFGYNEFDKPTKLIYAREGVVEEENFVKYNLFGEAIGESADNVSWPSYTNHNPNGIVWSTNAGDGAKTILLQDLTGAETLKFQAPYIDLEKVQYNEKDLFALLQQDPAQLERTESSRDLAGRELWIKKPFAFKVQNPKPTRGYKRDRWDNVLEEIDSLGNNWNATYNHRNQKNTYILPEIEAVNESGAVAKIRPKTTFLYNVMGCQLANTNALNQTESYKVDEAGQWVTHTLADGTIDQRRILNALCQVDETIDARAKHWSHQHNRLGLPTETILPSKKRINQTYDEKGGLSSASNPAGGLLRYNSDVRGNIWERYLPLGQFTRTKVDHNLQPLYVVNADNSELKWERDFFGHPLSHHNLEGKAYTYENDFKGQLHRQVASNGTKEEYAQIASNTLNDRVIFTPTYKPVSSLVDIEHQYQFGLLKKTYDASLNKTTEYENYDSEARPTDIVLSENGKVTHRYHNAFDALSRDIFSSDQHTSLFPGITTASVVTGYDAVNNKRHVQTKIEFPPSAKNTPRIRIDDNWYTYDVANRLLINGGSLINKHVQLQENKGVEFNYKDGLRTTEKRRLNNKDVLATLSYNEDSLLQDTDSEVITSHVDYHDGNWANNFEAKIKNPFPLENIYEPQVTATKDSIVLNQNGWQVEAIHRETDHEIWKGEHPGLFSKTTYPALSATGLPLQKTVTSDYDSKQKTTDDYTNVYAKFDNLQLRSVTGKRQNEYGNSAGEAKFLYDVNGTINAKLRSTDEQEYTIKPFADWLSAEAIQDIFYDTSNDGQILAKYYFNGIEVKMGQTEPTKIPIENKIYQFLYKPNQELVGGYGIEYSDQTMPKVTNLEVRNTLYPMAKFDLIDKKSKRSPLNFNDVEPPALGVKNYIVKPGDNFYSIARDEYGDEELAEKLALFNGLLSSQHALKPEQVLRLPILIGTHNKANNARPYRDFVSVMAGSLMPYLPMPQPKEDPNDEFLGVLIKVIAIALVFQFAPIVAQALLKGIIGELLVGAGMTAGTAQALTTGVIAALGDASVQGVAIGIGAQSRFSIPEVIETGVSAGVGQTMSGNLNDVEQLKEITLKIGTSAVATQLGEMALGLRSKFDARAVMLQVSSAMVSAKLSKGISKIKGLNESEARVANTVATTTANSILGSSITGTPINIQNMAANAIGSTIASEASQSVTAENNPDLQELAGAEEAANMQVDAASLPIGEHRYGDASYYLSEINRSRLERWTGSAPTTQLKANDSVFGFWSQLGNDAIDRGMVWLAQTHPDRARELSAGFKIINDVAHPLQTAQRLGEGAIYGAASLLTDPTTVFKNMQSAYNAYDSADPVTKGQIEAELYEGMIAPLAPAGIYKAGSGFTKWSMFGDEGAIVEYTSLRAAKMLEKDTGYNVSPSNWFDKYQKIGLQESFITDYRAIGEVTGPVRANTEFKIGFFSGQNQISYLKAWQLEKALGLEKGSLSEGFRLTRIPNISSKSVRSPLGGNDLFLGGGKGLPGGGPELTIDPILTKPWPPRRSP